jgi:lipopolysaccharide export LptBFGC system permease protein LptF
MSSSTGYFALLLALLGAVLFVSTTSLSVTGSSSSSAPSPYALAFLVILLALAGVVAFRRGRRRR